VKKFGDKTFDGLTSAVGRLLDATAAEYRMAQGRTDSAEAMSTVL